MMKRLTTSALAASLAATMFAAPALAQSVSIEWRDLDLQTVEGQRKLDKRIDDVARDICGLDEIRTGTRIKSRSAKQCYKEAKASAAKQVAAKIDRDRLGG